MNLDTESSRKQVHLVAKRLHFTYFKATTGETRKWHDATPEDRRIWTRLARISVKVLTDSTDGETVEQTGA